MALALDDLFSMEPETLFGLSARKSAGTLVRYWAPNVINPGCMTSPRCLHCKWECFKSEKKMEENRVPLDRVLATAERQSSSGIRRMLMPSGWVGYSIPDYYCDYVRAVKERVDIEVFGLFGAIDQDSLASLKQAGMDGYQCGLESVNPRVYRFFRPGGDSFDDRVRTLRWAKSVGLKLWSGFIVGVGETREDVIASIELLKTLEVTVVGVQPFMPFPHTALAERDPANPFEWARAIAAAHVYIDGAECLSVEAESPYANFSRMAGATWFPKFAPVKD